MADAFADQLRSELNGIKAELERLATRRRLLEELLRLESDPAAAPAAERSRRRPPSRPAAPPAPPAPPARRRRLPRGLISSKIREFLGGQREPVHATAILAYLEQHQAAPRSVKPMATLQSALQRLKEQGEVENTGRNHWRLRTAETAAPAPAAPPAASTASEAAAPISPAHRPAAGPPVVRSTTTFGTRPGAGG
ncbi:MAG: hypothetical protein OXH13_08340 [Chloroflexi bacterium]|nr:hypothetical protein [Chloroflexota bacterium]